MLAAHCLQRYSSDRGKENARCEAVKIRGGCEPRTSTGGNLSLADRPRGVETLPSVTTATILLHSTELIEGIWPTAPPQQLPKLPAPVLAAVAPPYQGRKPPVAELEAARCGQVRVRGLLQVGSREESVLQETAPPACMANTYHDNIRACMHACRCHLQY